MNTKILAVGIVAILAIGGIGVFMFANGNDSEGITIVDGSGKTVTIDKPLTNVAAINTNVPKALIMLGVDDSISCYHYTNPMDKPYEATAVKLGTYYTPSIETLRAQGVEAVLCPVSSMTLYAAYQTACENVGIKVIRLDCNGATLFDDLTKLSKLYGEPESAKKVIDEYTSNYTSVKNAIISALEGKDKKEYACTFTSRNALYNQTSAIHDTFSTVFGKNITEDAGLSTKGVTNEINEGCIEAIHSVQDKIQTLLIRSNSSDTTLAKYNSTYNAFVGEGKLVTSSCTAVSTGESYVLMNCLMSGLYAPFGLLIMAEQVYGIDITVTLNYGGTSHTYTGLSEINNIITDFQNAYSQNSIKNGNVLLAQYDSSGTGTALITYAA